MFESLCYFGRFFLRRNYHHAYTHVKHPVHFSIINISHFLDDRKNRRYIPAAPKNNGTTGLRQNAWNIVYESAAGYVDNTSYVEILDQIQEGFHVNLCRT